jgi:hypothetical protein
VQGLVSCTRKSRAFSNKLPLIAQLLRCAKDKGIDRVALQLGYFVDPEVR